MNPPVTPGTVVGISGESAASKSVQAMMDCVKRTGATPLLLANHAKRIAAEDIDKVDAVIVMGNNFDIDPNDYIHRYPDGDVRKHVHPRTKNANDTAASGARAAYEKQLIAAVLDAKMPLFCICGGMQMVNIFCGGTLHQHIPDLIGHEKNLQNAGMAAESPVVSVSVVPDTKLFHISQVGSLFTPGMPPLVPSSGTVNSFHHQAVDIVGADLIPSAYSERYTHPDGSEQRLIEAIEACPSGKYKDQFFLGVQWHPEFLPDNETSERIISDVSVEAEKFALENERVHEREQARKENILSALPMLMELSSAGATLTSGFASSVPRGKPGGKSR